MTQSPKNVAKEEIELFSVHLRPLAIARVSACHRKAYAIYVPSRVYKNRVLSSEILSLDDKGKLSQW